jgi:flagellar motility protein MotE (MotC chaperone)
MSIFKKVKIRILPVIIFMAVLMLSFRIGSIYNGFINKSTADSSRIRIAERQNIQNEFQIAMADDNKVEHIGRLTDQLQNEHRQSLDEDKGNAFADKFEINSDSINLGEPQENNCEAPTFTQSEIEVLQQLAFRREQLENQEQEIAKKFAILDAAQNQIDRKITKLKNLQTLINGLLIKHSEEEQKKLDSIAKMYASMKPKSAAKIFDQLDIETLLTVVENMKASQSGIIVANMDPIKAKELTAKLAERRNLPRPDRTTNIAP